MSIVRMWTKPYCPSQHLFLPHSVCVFASTSETFRQKWFTRATMATVALYCVCIVCLKLGVSNAIFIGCLFFEDSGLFQDHGGCTPGFYFQTGYFLIHDILTVQGHSIVCSVFLVLFWLLHS